MLLRPFAAAMLLTHEVVQNLKYCCLTALKPHFFVLGRPRYPVTYHFSSTKETVPVVIVAPSRLDGDLLSIQYEVSG